MHDPHDPLGRFYDAEQDVDAANPSKPMPKPGDPVSVEKMDAWIMFFVLGKEVPEGLRPVTGHEDAVYLSLEEEIADMAARGIGVDIPSQI